MPHAAVCPDLRQYQQLAAGGRADADEESLLKHLERCETCARKLNTLAEQDTLVELIRRQRLTPTAVPAAPASHDRGQT